MKILKIIKILRFSLKVPILGTLTPERDEQHFCPSCVS
jgi:hypothetical protein